MATTTTPGPSPESPEQTPSRPPSSSRARGLGRAAVLGAGAVAVIALGTLAIDILNEPADRPNSGPRAEPRAGDSVESTPGPGTACRWTTEADGPVFPANDIGGPPTPESVLIFESCGGELTGNIAWLVA